MKRLNNMNKLKLFVLAIGLGTAAQAQTLQDANKKTENERYDLARKDYQKLIQVDPTSVENAFFFGNFYATIGEKDSAITLWRKAGTINLEDKLAMVSAAKALYFSGDTTTAGQQFCEIIKKTKRKNPVVLHRIAETYATGPVKNLKLAEAYLRDVVRLDPKNLDAYVLLGDVLLAQSNSNASQATEQYNNALAIDPNSAKVIVRKAQIYQRVQNYKLANEEYKKAQAADPNYAPAYRENAELNILFDQYAAAIDMWEKYLKLNDTDEARYRYASSIFGAKQYCNVLPQLDRLTKDGFTNMYTKRMLYYSLYECNEAKDSLRYVQALKAGEDFFLAFSPERIDPGNKNWKTHNTPVVVGGINQESTELAAALHNLVVSIIKQVSTPSVAEMEKLLENIFRSVNIALVNEMAQLCDRLGINVWEVVDAAATKPFGFMPFYPGPGIGGHCILIDPYYLAWKAREKDFVTNFIQLAAEINEDMPFYVESMVIKEIAKQEVSLKNAKILILGMAFKKDVDDLRHSPALKVAELLEKDNILQIDYYDPYIPSIKLNGKELNSLKEINPKVLANYDVCVITTDHSVFDYEMIAANSKVVVDTRNACKNIKSRENIILLGEGK